MDEHTHETHNMKHETLDSDASRSTLHDPRCQQCEEYLAGWKRAQADYQNLKKDTERERTEYIKYANERLLHEILPAIDQFHLALKFTPSLEGLSAEDQKRFDNWLAGIKAVQTMWDQTAKAMGLELIPTDGAFDPALHEAASEEEKEGMSAGSIVSVVQNGWRLHGKVLRPARVIIAK